jgi:DNA-binding transcriptional LysR family regulator
MAVADLRRRLPDAAVTIRETGPPAALAALRRGEVDVAVVFRRNRDEAPDGIEERLLLEEAMFAVVPRAHALAGDAEVELAALSGDAWVQGPATTSPGLIRELCREAGFEPRIAFESDDPLATRGIVAAGLAVSLVPSLTKDDTARDRNVVVLPLRESAIRSVIAATVAGGWPTPATREMVDSLARAGRRIGRSSH